MENDKAFPKWKLILSIIAISSLPIILTSTPFYIVDFSNKGQVGDTIGGIMGPFIGILASVLTYMAFMVQFNANKQQREDIELERIRSNFFEMMSFYRMNVEELKYQSPENGDIVIGRKVFYVVYKQMLQILKEIDLFYKSANVSTILTKEFIEDYANTEMSMRGKIDLIELAKINHAYLILFYGVHEDGRKAIEQFLEGKYQEDFYKGVNHYMSLKPIKESKFWEDYEKLLNPGYNATDIKNYINNRNTWSKLRLEKMIVQEDKETGFPFYGDNFTKYYGGHQFRFGHFFRNFFNAVNYVNSQKSVSYSQKYDLIKMLRSQMSSYEQVLLFFNSLSFLGWPWELSSKNKGNGNLHLITKYDLIRNINSEKPNLGIKYKNYYPDVFFEFDATETPRKIELKSTYN